MIRVRACCFALYAAAGAPCLWARAQVRPGLDLTVANRYVWRGLMRKNGVVAQPDVYLAVPLSTGWLAAGTWADVELQPAGNSDLTDVGHRRVGVGEVDYWVSASGAMGVVDASVGWVAYRYHLDASPAGRDRTWNTSELYSSVRVRSAGWSPKLSVWWDVTRVRGGYVEASVTAPLLANPTGRPFWTVYVGALAGYNISQGPNANRPSELANFAGKGLTHIDLSLAVYFRPPVVRLPSRSTQLVGHLQVNRDDATRRHSLGVSASREPLTLWVAVVFSLPAYGREN